MKAKISLTTATAANKLPHTKRSSLSYTHRVKQKDRTRKQSKKTHSVTTGGVLQFKPSDYAPIYSPGKSAELQAAEANSIKLKLQQKKDPLTGAFQGESYVTLKSTTATGSIQKNHIIPVNHVVL